MAYELHITRTEDGSQPQPISLEEWWAVVDADPSLERVELLETTNPRTGEIIAARPRGLARWKPIGALLSWGRRGSISVAVRSEHPDLVPKLKALAAALGAFVRGDEGERY